MEIVSFYLFLGGFLFKWCDIACTNVKKRENPSLWSIGIVLWILLSTAIWGHRGASSDLWTAADVTMIPLVALFVGKKLAVFADYLLDRIQRFLDKICPPVNQGPRNLRVDWYPRNQR